MARSEEERTGNPSCKLIRTGNKRILQLHQRCLTSKFSWILLLMWNFVQLHLLFCLIPRVGALDTSLCTSPLGMESGDIPDADLTASTSYEAGNVGPQNGRVRLEKQGGAWCPKNQITSEAEEWIQIELHSVHVITAIETQGRFGNGHGQEFAEAYVVSYWRPELSRWVRYRDITGNEIIKGNINTYLAAKRELNPPIIASKIRVLPYSYHRRTVCMRVEIYGCQLREDYSKAQRHSRRLEECNTLQTTDTEQTPKTRLRSRSEAQPTSIQKRKKARKPSSGPHLVAVNPVISDDSSDLSDSSTYVPTENFQDDELMKRLDALQRGSLTINGNYDDAAGTSLSNSQSLTKSPRSSIPQTDITSLVEKVSRLEQRQEAFEKTILMSIAEIKGDVKELLLRTKPCDSKQRVFDQFPFDLPLKTENDIKHVEQWLVDDLNRNKFVLHCSTFGGNNVGKIVRRILTRLFSCDLAKQINFIGANNKVCFGKLRLKAVVIDATRGNIGQSKATQFEIEDAIKKWFQNTRDLNGGRTARKNVVLQNQASNDLRGSATTTPVN